MNGGETVTWAKKPAIPENRKRAVYKKTVERTLSKKICPKCELLGVNSPLHLFQINYDEALLMCKNADCTFMSSSNWETLVVNRDLSKIPTGGARKTASSSLPSSGTSTYNLGVLSRSSSPLPHSTPLLPAAQLQSRGTSSAISRLESTSACKGTGVAADPPEPSVERKTLVPLAPFLCGHAHTFASYETKKIEDKLRKRNAVPSVVKPRFAKADLPVAKVTAPCALKRRGSSLDSFSSSSRSRSPSPVLIEAENKGKVKKIFVAPETLSKIINGSLTLKVVKQWNPETQNDHTVPASDFSNNITPVSSSAHTPVPKGSNNASLSNSPCSLDIEPVGPIEDVLRLTQASNSATSKEKQSLPALHGSTSHIDAINQLFAKGSYEDGSTCLAPNSLQGSKIMNPNSYLFKTIASKFP